ncbi:hypothetical protein ACPWT1_07940 [Ramlibacter sp. MMS24-I3-19]|uniref:hypothetical protein n=1 Tax=Ramlibacter sp. MMS24-I3-19 TaxID=3416606 RepID=UPI003D0943FA
MITAVAETKFRTRTGLPVSVVGLHGKDELLVVGPAWALRELANGRATHDLRPVQSEFDVLEDVKQHTLEEVLWLARVPQLVAQVQEMQGRPVVAVKGHADLLRETCSTAAPTVFRDEQWPLLEKEIVDTEPLEAPLAMQFLRGFFWCGEETIFEYFDSVHPDEFAKQYLAEAVSHFDRIVRRLAAAEDPHPAWWLSWDGEAATRLPEFRSNFLTDSGRNVCRYPVAGEDSMRLLSPRRYSMHRRWRTLVQSREESASKAE